MVPRSDDGYARFLLEMIAWILPKIRNRRIRRMLLHYHAILANRPSGEPLTEPLIADYILRALFLVQNRQS